MKTFNKEELEIWANEIEPNKESRLRFLSEEVSRYKKQMLFDIGCIRKNNELNKLNPNTYYVTSAKRFEEDIEVCQRKVKSLEYQLGTATGTIKPNKENITEEMRQKMKQKAKDFPIIDILGLPDIKGNSKCPFHNDKTPSFMIRKNEGHCFGCGWHGDSIAAYMEINSVKFLEAVRHLNK